MRSSRARDATHRNLYRREPAAASRGRERRQAHGTGLLLHLRSLTVTQPTTYYNPNPLIRANPIAGCWTQSSARHPVAPAINTPLRPLAPATCACPQPMFVLSKDFPFFNRRHRLSSILVAIVSAGRLPLSQHTGAEMSWTPGFCRRGQVVPGVS